MSNFFGDFVDQTVTRTMGTLQNLGVGIVKSAQANAIGYANATINRVLAGAPSSVRTGLSLGGILGQVIAGTNIQYNRFVYSNTLAMASAQTPMMEYSGLVPDVQGDIPPQYIITIQNSYNRVVRAALQEAFSMSTTSEWIPFLNPKLSDTLVKATALFHMSLFPRFASRRVWRGTSPIQMKLRLKFEAVNDSWREVVLPCLRLMQMSLPGTGQRRPFSWIEGLSNVAVPVLEPPGPSPFMLDDNIKTNWDTGNLTDVRNRLNSIVASGSDQIRIKIGRLLQFDNVIVENVQVEYSNKFDMNGRPIGAVVDIAFSTYEIYTKEAIEESHITQG